ncbi:sensor histidine kinase [Beijerinckia sp. L45]|uniref:ATP-binding protein n=1 Tax=Beijerinckia sp. L45 TaxID=1641855 RepID=UPI00131ACA50|nr:sensor histidine kinase [Beijerinckia sp. L45]
MFGDPRTRSLATRLFISATVLSVTILLIAGLILTAVYRTSAEAAFDERLGVYLRALVADLASASPGDDAKSDRPESGQLADPQFELTLSGWYWQITRLDGPKPDIKASRSLFAARLPRLADSGVPAELGGSRRGYANGPDDRPLRIVERIIDTGDQGVYLVQVAATTEEIEAQMLQFEIDLTITFAILAVMLVGSSALQLRYGLQPLRRLQEGVIAIRRGDNEKIEGIFPRDIAPLAGELNLMIEANRDVVERARTQVGNLAHALKTPLSVIVNEAAREQGGFAAKVSEQATMMRDQVAYYLERARAAVSARKIGSATEVEPVVRGLVRTFEKIYHDRGLVFVEEGGAGIRFLGEKQDLEEMIGNLVDNAGKWAQSTVSIGISGETDKISERAYFRVTIDDDGPGLDPGLRAAAIKRGQRLDESKPGSGLGLSIVDDLARIYGGAFTLETSPTSGLRAELRLPAS